MRITGKYSHNKPIMGTKNKTVINWKIRSLTKETDAS